MKLIFISSALILLFGCSSHPNNPSGNHVFPQRNPRYMMGGTFTGTWTYLNVTDSCIAVLTKADSILLGTITNDSTEEVLSLTGKYFLCPDCGDGYQVLDTTSKRSDFSGGLYFSGDSTSFNYIESRGNNISLYVNCKRK
jgi:hypothetical protein